MLSYPASLEHPFLKLVTIHTGQPGRELALLFRMLIINMEQEQPQER